MIRPAYALKIAARHVREVRRERRTIIGLFLVPVVVVLLFTVGGEEIASDLATQARSTHMVAVQGSANAPTLIQFLRTQRLRLIEVPDAATTIRERKRPVAIVIPSGFEADVEAARSPTIQILSAERSSRAQFAQAAVANALQTFAKGVTAKRLERAGLPVSVLDPIVLQPVDLTNSRQRTGSLLGQIVPFMLLGQVVGMMSSVAIDVTAGEKERRTVEGLLASPLTRREIVAGKWIVTVGIGLLSAATTLAGILVALRFNAVGEALDLPYAGIGWTALGAVAIVMVMSSIQISIGLFARSVQQAGIFLMPLVFLVLFPILLLSTRTGSSIGAPVYALPGLGPTLLIKYGLEETAHALAGPIVAISSAIYAAAGIWVADRLFNSERALLRTGG